jgi:hypothetical protein
MTFQSITVTVALSVLVLMLLFIGIMLYRSKLDEAWPPQIAECPDYFKVVGLEQCNNVKNLGTCPGTTDFSGTEWQGKSGLKKKKAWAQSCGVVWDGVTN